MKSMTVSMEADKGRKVTDPAYPPGDERRYVRTAKHLSPTPLELLALRNEELSREIERLELENSIGRAFDLVQEQAEDDGLWCTAETATEAYLQRALRKLHAAVEGEAIAFRDELQCRHEAIKRVEKRECLTCGELV